MKAAMHVALTVCAAVLLAASGRAAGAQLRRQGDPPLVIASVYGKDLFTFYCSSCHGRDGKGAAGSDASAARPPDLTTLTTRAGNAFPRERVAAIIRGDVSLITPAHGSKEMPVWGPIFRSLDPHDAMNAERIGNIVEYLESIQGK